MRLILLILFVSVSPSLWAMGNLSQQADHGSLRVNSPVIGKAAPDVSLIKSDGTTASIMAARQGQKAILIFWATWCPHCYEEMGFINDNWSTIEQKGIKIILVDIGETTQQVKDYFNKRQMKLVSFVDVDTFLQEPYRLEGIPSMVFIDDKGIIRSVTHEFPSDYENYFSTN